MKTWKGQIQKDHVHDVLTHESVTLRSETPCLINLRGLEGVLAQREPVELLTSLIQE